MATFLLLYRPGSAWTPGKPAREQPPAEHGRYLLRLYAAGTLRLAGPFGDNTGAAIVLEAPDIGAAEALAQADPAVQAAVFEYALHPWELVPWERYLRPAEPPSGQR